MDLDFFKRREASGSFIRENEIAAAGTITKDGKFLYEKWSAEDFSIHLCSLDVENFAKLNISEPLRAFILGRLDNAHENVEIKKWIRSDAENEHVLLKADDMQLKLWISNCGTLTGIKDSEENGKILRQYEFSELKLEGKTFVSCYVTDKDLPPKKGDKNFCLAFAGMNYNQRTTENYGGKSTYNTFRGKCVFANPIDYEREEEYAR